MKAFDREPCCGIWWAMRKLVGKCVASKSHASMYKDFVSKIRDSHEYNDEFSVQLGINQGSIISLLLFIIVF